jgi:hypothetical protein
VIVAVVRVCPVVTGAVVVVGTVGGVELCEPPSPERISNTAIVIARRNAAGATYRASPCRLVAAARHPYQPETAQISPASLAASVPAAARQSPLASRDA